MTIKGVKDIYVGSFYKSTGNDENSLLELWSSLSKIPENSIIWLLGDFDLPCIDWRAESLKSNCKFKVMYEYFMGRIQKISISNKWSPCPLDKKTYYISF